MRQGCTNKNAIFKFLLIFAFIVSLSSVNFSSASDAALAASVSIVESGSFEPGDTFHCIVEIRNSQASGRQDVYLSYEILDGNEMRVLLESTTVAIETLSSFSEDLKLPEYSGKGVYTLKVTVSTLDKSDTSQASVSFKVNPKVVSEGEQRFAEYFMAIALIVTVIALVYEHRRISKLKVSGRDLKKFVSDERR